ncbi:MAG: hypothetical protein ACRDF6_04840 [bacterium]
MDGSLSLDPRTGREEGPETVLELLNSPLRVIPFILAADQSVLLLTRLNIDWVVAGPSVPASLIRPPAGDPGREEPVQVWFVDGRSMDGMLQLERSGHQSRASDLLNGRADFYPMTTRLGTLLVNKSRVRETRLLASSQATARPAD